MAKVKDNNFAVCWEGAGDAVERTVQLYDGTLLFSASKSAAKRDLLAFVREWRRSMDQPRSRYVAVKLNDDRTRYQIAKRGAVVGIIAVTELPPL